MSYSKLYSILNDTVLFAGGKKKPLKQPKKAQQDLDEVSRLPY